MKKFMYLILTAVLCAIGLTAHAAPEDITVFVDDQQVEFDTVPVIKNDRILVPVRAVAEAMGADVHWGEDSQSVQIEKTFRALYNIPIERDYTLKFSINDNDMKKQVKDRYGDIYDIDLYKNSETSVALEAPARIIDERTFIPLRALSEAFDASVEWDGERRRADIKTRNDEIMLELTPDAPTEKNNFKEVAKKPDADGIIWSYSTFTDNEKIPYLLIRDEENNRERFYPLVSDDVKVTEDAIYFAEYSWIGLLIRLPFANNEETRNGEVLDSYMEHLNISDFFFDGDHAVIAGITPGNGAHGRITAYNILTGEKAFYFEEAWWTGIRDIKPLESTDEKLVIEFTTTTTGPYFRSIIVFDKAANAFGKAVDDSVKNVINGFFYVQNPDKRIINYSDARIYKEEQGIDLLLVSDDEEKTVLEYTPYPITDKNERHTVIYDKKAKTFIRRADTK